MNADHSMRIRILAGYAASVGAGIDIIPLFYLPDHFDADPNIFFAFFEARGTLLSTALSAFPSDSTVSEDAGMETQN
jgi:hypothetical protein